MIDQIIQSVNLSINQSISQPTLSFTRISDKLLWHIFYNQTILFLSTNQPVAPMSWRKCYNKQFLQSINDFPINQVFTTAPARGSYSDGMAEVLHSTGH